MSAASDKRLSIHGRPDDMAFLNLLARMIFEVASSRRNALASPSSPSVHNFSERSSSLLYAVIHPTSLNGPFATAHARVMADVAKAIRDEASGI